MTVVALCSERKGSEANSMKGAECSPDKVSTDEGTQLIG